MPERAERIRATLAAAGAPVVEARAHRDGALLTVHDGGLVRFLATAWEEWEAARAGVDCALTAVDLLLEAPRPHTPAAAPRPSRDPIAVRRLVLSEQRRDRRSGAAGRRPRAVGDRGRCRRVRATTAGCSRWTRRRGRWPGRRWRRSSSHSAWMLPARTPRARSTSPPTASGPQDAARRARSAHGRRAGGRLRRHHHRRPRAGGAGRPRGRAADRRRDLTPRFCRSHHAQPGPPTEE